MAENIFIFVPNLIGFSRIFMALVAFYFMPTNYIVASLLYILSSFLDSFDGYAARIFNQATKFGAMLDMLTDRCGTMCLLVMLAHFYPKYMFAFQLSMAIDISCHWLHVHTSILCGVMSHKSNEVNVNPILKLYYTSKPILFIMCTGNELFYALLYLLHFTEGPMLPFGLGFFRALCYICFPVAVVKIMLALMQGYYAAITMSEVDVKARALEREKKN